MIILRSIWKKIQNIVIEEKAITILRNYNGTNDYILWLKRQLTAKALSITKTQAKYVVDNAHILPSLINKYLPIHPFYGYLFKKQFGLETEPTHILIYKILSRKGDELHVWGAFEKDSKYHMSIYISKKAFKKQKELPTIDLEKYKHRPPQPHQIPAIEKLLTNDEYILADVMGLGKTCSAIIAAIEGGYKKILVLCPASLKLNWKREIACYQSESDISIVDTNNFTAAKWTIINYDILRYHHHLPTKDAKEELPVSPIDFNKYDLVIADECHKLKSIKSQRTKIVMDFASRIPAKWLLTGTPIANHPIDLFSLLSICNSPLSQNWQAFVKRYCNGFKITNKQTKKSFWKTSGASNLEELKYFISDLMLRRTKSELNLPLKTTKPIFYTLSNANRYTQYIEEYEQWVEDMREQEIPIPITAHLTKLIKVRQLVSQDKMDHTIALAEDYIEEGYKVIIFSCFTDTIRGIHEHFGKQSVLVDGSVSLTKRQMAVDSFQENDKVKIFCGNIIAAGVGLTLTKGDVIIFNDLDWVPSNHDQASDRSHRIGREGEVLVVYQLIEETIDTVMFQSLMEKMDNINKVTGDDSNDFSVSEQVLKSLRKK